MDAIGIFALCGFLGALLAGIQGYLERDSQEGFSAKKFVQTMITAVIAGLLIVNASIGTISPDANWIVVGITGLLAGYGADTMRNKVGLKV